MAAKRSWLAITGGVQLDELRPLNLSTSGESRGQTVAVSAETEACRRAGTQAGRQWVDRKRTPPIHQYIFCFSPGLSEANPRRPGGIDDL